MSESTGEIEVPVKTSVLGSVEGGGRRGEGRGSKKGVRVRWVEGVVEEEVFEDSVTGLMEVEGESPPSCFLMETLI